MSYRQIEHTGDIAVEIEAGDREALFAEALLAMTDCVTELSRVRPERRHQLRAEASDIELLLVEWLNEALYLFEVEEQILARARVEIGESEGRIQVVGEVAGETFDPGRHGLKVPIKAVTYHALRVWEEGDRWRARVVFDI